jgi:MFS transporter, DHA2 family, metal-tetracycline-proton antiporter
METTAVASRYRAATVGLINLCYLLGAAFGPAIAALA